MLQKAVRPKPGIGNQNRKHVPIFVPVSEPKLFLPKLPGGDWRTRSSCYCENLSMCNQRLSSHTTHCRQALNRPCVAIITDEGSSIIMVYSVEQSKPILHKEARTKSNRKTKHAFIFVLIILRVAFVMIVRHG